LSLAKFWPLILGLVVYEAVVNLPDPARVVRAAVWIVPAIVILVSVLGLVGTAWSAQKGLVAAEMYGRIPTLISRLPQSPLSPVTRERGWNPNELSGTLDLLIFPALALAFWARGN